MKRKNSGFTLVEILVGVSILGGAILAFVGSSNFLSKKNKDTQESIVISNYVNGLYNSIQSNLDLYQVTYDSKEFYGTTSPKDLQDKLPIAWNSTMMVDKADCPLCPGRLGYIIEPVNGYRGLFKLTIRVTHPKIVGFKDYTMILIGK
jgi:prepilin-type N-terminal cleavage/methylation domain-containing protein